MNLWYPRQLILLSQFYKASSNKRFLTERYLLYIILTRIWKLIWIFCYSFCPITHARLQNSFDFRQTFRLYCISWIWRLFFEVAIEKLATCTYRRRFYKLLNIYLLIFNLFLITVKFYWIVNCLFFHNYLPTPLIFGDFF